LRTVRTLVAIAFSALSWGSPNAQQIVLFIHSMQAPGFGSVGTTQCPNPKDLACLAAAAENVGPVPESLLWAFKSSFSNVRFVETDVPGARRVVGGIRGFRQGFPGFEPPSCEVSGFVSPGSDTGTFPVQLPSNLAPPYGSSPADEALRRDRATEQCLAGLGARMNEQLK